MEKHDAASAQTSWAGSNYVASSLAPGGTFNPRIPLISALVDGAEDELVWDDTPESLWKRIKNGTQKITSDCMAESAEACPVIINDKVLGEHVLMRVSSIFG